MEAAKLGPIKEQKEEVRWWDVGRHCWRVSDMRKPRETLYVRWSYGNRWIHAGEYSVHAYYSSRNPGARGEHLTIQLLWATVGLLVTRFIVLSTQWMKEMRTWDRSEITSYCVYVWCESSLLLRLKSQSSGEIEMSAGWQFMVWLLGF